MSFAINQYNQFPREDYDRDDFGCGEREHERPTCWGGEYGEKFDN